MLSNIQVQDCLCLRFFSNKMVQPVSIGLPRAQISPGWGYPWSCVRWSAWPPPGPSPPRTSCACASEHWWSLSLSLSLGEILLGLLDTGQTRVPELSPDPVLHLAPGVALLWPGCPPWLVTQDVSRGEGSHFVGKLSQFKTLYLVLCIFMMKTSQKGYRYSPLARGTSLLSVRWNIFQT